MNQKSSLSENKFLIASFVFTLIISSIAAVYLFFPTSHIIQHLPSTYNFNVPDWMKLISSDAEKVTALNFTQIFQKSGNYSLFPSTNLLVLSNITTQITALNSEFLASVLYINPKPDSEDLAINIIKPKTNTFSVLKKELEEKINIKSYYMTYIIYQVSRLNDSGTNYVNGYLTIDGGCLLYSEEINGLEIIKKSIDSKIGSDQFSEKISVKASMYLLLTGKNDELGYSYSTLPYSVNETASVSTSVRYESNSVIASYVFGFKDTASAFNNLSNIKQANLNSVDFSVIDNFIVTDAKFDSSFLQRELRSL
jgi:hypothetical protein